MALLWVLPELPWYYGRTRMTEEIKATPHLVIPAQAGIQACIGACLQPAGVSINDGGAGSRSMQARHDLCSIIRPARDKRAGMTVLRVSPNFPSIKAVNQLRGD